MIIFLYVRRVIVEGQNTSVCLVALLFVIYVRGMLMMAILDIAKKIRGLVYVRNVTRLVVMR